VQGKSRHPVRRSNSSPEMSSSWKGDARLPPEPDEMLLLPGTEPAYVRPTFTPFYKINTQRYA
jgi:hypothetical protein